MSAVLIAVILLISAIVILILTVAIILQIYPSVGYNHCRMFTIAICTVVGLLILSAVFFIIAIYQRFF